MNKLTATNIYRKVAGKWYMVHHHASWHADSEVAKMALTNGGGGNMKSNKNSEQQSKMTFNPAGILGTKDFGPFLGSGNGEKQQQPTVKKIIMGGSLSDILNGSLGDIISGGDGDETSAIIKISSMEDIDDDDDDDDDDDLDDDVEDVDEEVSSFVKELHMIREQNKSSSQSKNKKAGHSSNNNNKGDSPQDSVRQNCITALRRLADQGSISRNRRESC
jgi:hypothetical protein